MLDAAVDLGGSGARGIAFTPRGYPGPRSGGPVVFGDHPVPGPASFAAGRRLLEHVRQLRDEDVVLFLLSGGGSATVEVPAPPVRPADLARTTELLLACGAPIGAMNAVRRHLSLLKGGQLAAPLGADRFATVAISDVADDAPEEIASGPTVADPTTFRDALQVLRRHPLGAPLPRRALERLRAGARGEVGETPKPGDPRLTPVRFVLGASNRRAVRAAAREAARRHYRVRLVPEPMVGETQPVARRFARALLSASSGVLPPTRVALLAGGETTVTLGPRPGKGGRNGEFAVASARLLHGREALVLSAGTDGVDGPTDSAGGWVDGASWGRATRLGLDLPGALASHATYEVLERLGSLLRTGPTGTNVTDVHVGLAVGAGVGRVSRGTGGSSRRRAARTSRRRRS